MSARSSQASGWLGSQPSFVMYMLNVPGWCAQLLYRQLNAPPEVRWVTGQSPGTLNPEKLGLPPEQSWPFGMKPSIRPAPSERSTENQL